MSKKQRADGWWYPWIFVAAFGVIFTANGSLAYFAVTTWTGLDTKDYFNRGVSYNAVLEQRARQDALGWGTAFEFNANPTPKKPYGGQISVQFSDKNGLPIADLDVQGLARRPTQDGFDQTLSFTNQNDGRYVAEAPLPLPGLWELRYTATRDEAGGDKAVFKMRSRFQTPR